MHGFEFLDEIVLLCFAGLAVILVFQRFRLPPIIGLITAGLLIGPSGFGLVREGAVITAISELGVVMLLFTIGLEFSLEDLKRLRKIVLVGGPLQVTLSTIVIGCGALIAASLTGLPISLNGAILIGMSMALSSTAICIKMLKDRRELGMPHGRAVMGILIFQDIAVVPMMIIVTLLSSDSAIDTTDIVLRISTLIGVTVGLVVGLRFILPRLVPFVTRVSAPEVLILGGLALCFGAAWITSTAGISMALGAFIAGVAIAGSEEGHAIGKVMEPMRDAFTSVFFLSVGLLVQVSWTWLPVNILTAMLVLVANAIVVMIILASIRVNLRTAVMAGVILAQVGEFSFVLATVGVEYGVITTTDFQNMLVSIIFTMIVTPTLVTLAPVIAERITPLTRFFPRFRKWDIDDKNGAFRLGTLAENDDDGPTVMIVGAGVLGRNVATVLRETGINYRILELDRENVAALRTEDEPVIAGDITDAHALALAGIHTASVVIIAISDQTAIAQGVQLVRRIRPDVLIIVRSRYARDSESALQRGADEVVVEEFESSIKVFTAVLSHLGVDATMIEQQERTMREDMQVRSDRSFSDARRRLK
ncbi:MAG TPA: cation:proton antiporter [Candidatus Didemnitutus sp.]|nr:cation:proton antiporter [Candidatus Didemnitutus sp.]